ncbi:MAG TPA: response regulator [Blastocatellia bacterium]|nr:response regulator [Blastocatellia bacterium]
MMDRMFDPEDVAGFIVEANGYLPDILQGIEDYLNNRSNVEKLEKAYCYTHSIKGGASVLGFKQLSEVASHLEALMLDLGDGQLTVSKETALSLRQATIKLANHLDEVSADALKDASGCPTDQASAAGEPVTPDEPAELRTQAEDPLPPPAVTAAHPAAREEELLDLPDELSDLRAVVVGEMAGLDLPDLPGAQAAPRVEHAVTGALVVNGSAVNEPAFPSAELLEELAEIFALEAREHLWNMGSSLRELGGRPDDRELLQSIRRTAHSLRGAAATVGYREVAELTHRMEDLLDRLCQGRLEATKETLQLLLLSTDTLKGMIDGSADARAVEGLYDRYARTLGAKSPEPATPEPVIPADDAPAQAKGGQFVRIPIGRLDELVSLTSELVVMRASFEQCLTGFARQLEDLRSSSERLKRVSSRLETQPEAGSDGSEPDRDGDFQLLARELAETAGDARVISGALDALTDDLAGFLNRQSRLSGEIQEKLMRLRLVPLATLATRLHRIVGNVAAQQGKQVELVLAGAETELDKAVIEELSDPLQHILRNAVDHGIEPPAAREARGKSPKGTIQISAWGEGTQVVVQIQDDGNGLDAEELRAIAVRQGIFPRTEDASEMADEDLWPLIFLPSFSTSRDAGEGSGRGVGMDVVQTAVRRLRGSISVDSRSGQGTSFIIRLPMTLAVMPVMMVKSGQETYAIPLGDITETLRGGEHQIDHSGETPVTQVDGQMLPVVRLSDLLRPGSPVDKAEAHQPALILRVNNRQVALVVDQTLGGREIVVRNLGNHLRHVHGVMGATLVADGSVALILNLAELVGDSVRGPASETAGDTTRLDPVTSVLAGQPAPASAALPSATMTRELAGSTSALPIQPPSTGQNPDAITVMVVDDSPSARRVSTGLLGRMGWNSLQARDGLEALEYLQNSATTPDLLLLDLEMPRMDGYQLLAALRSQPAWRNLPVVIVTTQAGDAQRQRVMELGATDYLVKPYQDGALASLISRLVGQKQ